MNILYMPIKIRKNNKSNTYKVYNAITKEVHSYATTKEKAERQKRLIDAIDNKKGKGIFDDVKNKAKNKVSQLQNFTKTLINGRKGLSPNVNKFLSLHGNEIIEKAFLCRHPVSSGITTAINVASLGEFGNNMNNAGYTKLFHLSINFTTANGTYFKNEKTSQIDIVQNPKDDKTDETLNISFPKVSINQMLEKTEKYMTTSKFLNYSSRNNNCQDYIYAVLHSNGVNNSQADTFIKQETKQLFGNNTGLRKFTNTVTDAGNKADIILQGGKISLSVK